MDTSAATLRLTDPTRGGRSAVFAFITMLEMFPAGPNKMRVSVSQMKARLQSCAPAAQADPLAANFSGAETAPEGATPTFHQHLEQKRKEAPKSPVLSQLNSVWRDSRDQRWEYGSLFEGRRGAPDGSVCSSS